ncbi:hypothetical protein C1C98_30110 [Pseudomonas ogarae]|uniref:Uncharacterized protein n=1 Tax=Pseudomonas ogarae (strain DSM 112162 / CECT 30235 / F113) TaxID=1114970 RepID=A0ABM6R7H0_PSEO1|nr:hypothetical protein C1C98_30110 [Pseudomonas ogarae]
MTASVRVELAFNTENIVIRYPLIGPVQIYSLGFFSYDQKFSCSRPANSGVSVLLIWGLIWFFDCGQYKAIIIQ